MLPSFSFVIHKSNYYYICSGYIDESNYFLIYLESVEQARGDPMAAKRSMLLPETHTATEFLRGRASMIFKEVAVEDKDVVVYKNNKPQVAIISYEKYKELIERGFADEAK